MINDRKNVLNSNFDPSQEEMIDGPGYKMKLLGKQFSPNILLPLLPQSTFKFSATMKWKKKFIRRAVTERWSTGGRCGNRGSTGWLWIPTRRPSEKLNGLLLNSEHYVTQFCI